MAPTHNNELFEHLLLFLRNGDMFCVASEWCLSWVEWTGECRVAVRIVRAERVIGNYNLILSCNLTIIKLNNRAQACLKAERVREKEFSHWFYSFVYCLEFSKNVILICEYVWVCVYICHSFLENVSALHACKGTQTFTPAPRYTRTFATKCICFHLFSNIFSCLLLMRFF